MKPKIFNKTQQHAGVIVTMQNPTTNSFIKRSVFNNYELNRLTTLKIKWIEIRKNKINYAGNYIRR